MANIQHIADRIFKHADAGHLPAGYALAMGALIDAYGVPPARDDDPDFHVWVDSVSGSAVEKMIARMVRHGAWNDPGWLREYVWEASKESAA
ncbi:MAG: hypothetical protein ACYDB0_01005 [Acidithiobacillus sp.]